MQTKRRVHETAAEALRCSMPDGVNMRPLSFLVMRAKPHEVSLKTLDALTRQAKMRCQHIESNWTLALTKKLQVALLNFIETESINALDFAHAFDVA